MNNNASNNLWAKLIALDPYKEDIRLFSQPEGLDEGLKPSTGWTISQTSTGDTWITNLSAFSINIDGDWLDTNREKEIFSGQRISFNKDKDSQDEDFDHVFHIMNPQAKNSTKRKKEESLEPQIVPENLETTKLVRVSNDLEQGLSCSICMKIFHKCVALNPCHHTFCSWCIIYSLKSSIRCPLCRIEATAITKNFDLQNLVELTLRNFPEKGRPKEEIEQKQNDLEGSIVKIGKRIYIGSFQNEKKEGRGNMIFSNGNIYEGTWVDDKREGRGSLTFLSGDICKGQWLNDVVQNIDEIIFANKGVYKGEITQFSAYGKGVLKYFNGSIYDGSFVRDQIEGFGRMVYHDGDEYDGEWKRGLQNGTGTMKYAGGSVYKGEWRNGEREGEGALIFGDGGRYEGSWMNDCFHGKGKYIWGDGEEYEGDWTEDNRNGIGRMKYIDGGIYEGEWKNDSREGKGILTLANGNQYQGIWNEDVLEAVRKVSYINGNTYEGEVQMENLTRQGKGVLTFKNGDKYEGEWSNDKKHGKGREVCRDGELIYEGLWKEGKMSEVIMTEADGVRYKVKWEQLDGGEEINKKQYSDGRQFQEDEQNTK